VSVAAKFKELTRSEQLSIVFYIVSGVILLAIFPFSGLALHLALIGVFSIITGAVVLVKRSWALWFLLVQFITALVFAFWTIFTVGASNWLVTVSLIVYVVLEIAAILVLTIMRKTDLL
jgi:hypothetical protein